MDSKTFDELLASFKANHCNAWPHPGYDILIMWFTLFVDGYLPRHTISVRCGVILGWVSFGGRLGRFELLTIRQNRILRLAIQDRLAADNEKSLKRLHEDLDVK